MELPIHVAVAIGGLVIGVIFGAAVQRSGFCMMGAVADIAINGSWQRMRAWLLAIAVAVLGTQLVRYFGIVTIEQTPYLSAQLPWAGHVIGGFLFGFGMILACGCGSRNLVNLGAGDLRALVALVFLGIGAYATLRGIIAIPRVTLLEATTVDLTARGMSTQGVEAVLTLSGLGGTLALAVLVAVALAAIALSDRTFRTTMGYVAASAIIGACVVAGWLVTAILGADDFEPAPLGSLTFVAPVGDAMLYLMTYTGSQVDFGIAVVGGVILGAAASALATRSFRWQAFEDVRDMARYIVGGLLMGCGGVLSLGCTVGQGITGVSTLSIGSWLTFASIIAGGLLGARYLEQGSLAGMARSLLRRTPAETRG